MQSVDLKKERCLGAGVLLLLALDLQRMQVRSLHRCQGNEFCAIGMIGSVRLR